MPADLVVGAFQKLLLRAERIFAYLVVNGLRPDRLAEVYDTPQVLLRTITRRDDVALALRVANMP